MSERDAFEAWWQSRLTHKPARNLEPGYYDEYENPSAQMAWKGWQARAAQQDGAREADRIGLAKALFEADRLEYADEAIARSWNEMHKFIDDPDYAYKHPSWRAELIAARDQFLRMADAALMHLHRHEQGQ